VGAMKIDPGSQRFDFNGVKIMVVDDSSPSLDLISKVLLGFGVTDRVLCQTVSEASSKLSSQKFDLIIADAEMPDEDGFDLTRWLRSDRNGPNFTAPVLIASGYTPLSKVAQARDAGANLVVLKPVVPGILLSRIRWLAKAQRQFVESPGYCGPDRRRRNGPLPPGMEERRADALRLMEQPERAMSQNEIDGLFG
jgi:CheY-like chemotaxis protein